jgi:hypothetical protein
VPDRAKLPRSATGQRRRIEDGQQASQRLASTVSGRPTWSSRPALAGRPLVVAAVGAGAGVGPDRLLDPDLVAAGSLTAVPPSAAT